MSEWIDIKQCPDCGYKLSYLTGDKKELSWCTFCDLKKEAKKKEWIDVNNEQPPKNGKSFLACIWGEWVGQCIYARHYDAGDRCPGKYEFYYVTQNPENEGWRIRIEDKPFPITHWMPLPAPPEKPS